MRKPWVMAAASASGYRRPSAVRGMGMNPIARGLPAAITPSDVAELATGAREEMARVAELGGAVEAVDYMKASLVESHRERWQRIESGDLTVVGMNKFTSTEPSPLTADADGGIRLFS